MGLHKSRHEKMGWVVRNSPLLLVEAGIFLLKFILGVSINNILIISPSTIFVFYKCLAIPDMAFSEVKCFFSLS